MIKSHHKMCSLAEAGKKKASKNNESCVAERTLFARWENSLLNHEEVPSSSASWRYHHSNQSKGLAPRTSALVEMRISSLCILNNKRPYSTLAPLPTHYSSMCRACDPKRRTRRRCETLLFSLELTHILQGEMLLWIRPWVCRCSTPRTTWVGR